MPKVLTTTAIALTTLGLGAAATYTPAPAAQVSLDLATLHAAALSASRGAGDSTDAPYILVSIVEGAGRSATMELPATGHFTIHLDQALGATPITKLDLQPGDSVRVLLSVLEANDAANNELPVATATTRTLTEQKWRFANPAASVVTPALAPLTGAGAHWLGSASILLLNKNGIPVFGSFDCVQSCKVLASPAKDAVGAEVDAGGASGVVELSGASGTYHMKLSAKRI
jgi:hypothetical protein